MENLLKIGALSREKRDTKWLTNIKRKLLMERASIVEVMYIDF